MFKLPGLLSLLAAMPITMPPPSRLNFWFTGARKIVPTTATRAQIDPDPTLSRQQRRYAERLAAKRAKRSAA